MKTADKPGRRDTEKPSAPPQEALAGRPLGYWKRLTESRELQPQSKATPVAQAVVERLPKDKLDEMLAQISSAQANRTIGVAILKYLKDNFDKLNSEDSFAIVSRSIKERFEDACFFIDKFPLAKQGELLGNAVKLGNVWVVEEAWDRVAPTLPENEQAELIDTVLGYNFPQLGMKACKQLGAITDIEKQSQLVKKALFPPKYECSLAAFEFAMANFPEKQRIEIIKYALTVPSDISQQAWEEARKLPTEGHGEYLMLALKQSYLPTSLSAAVALFEFSEEKRTKELVDAAGAALLKIIEKQETDPTTNSEPLLPKTDLIAKFPLEWQSKLIKQSLTVRYNGKALDEKFVLARIMNCKLIPALPEEMQKELWADATDAVKVGLHRELANIITQEALAVVPLLPIEKKSELMKWAVDFNSTSVRATQTAFMKLLPDDLKLEMINKVLKTKIAENRIKACAMISELPEEQQVQLLKQVLNNFHSEMRINAFEAIAKLPKEQQLKLLEYALKEIDHTDVKLEAVRSVLSVPQISFQEENKLFEIAINIRPLGLETVKALLASKQKTKSWLLETSYDQSALTTALYSDDLDLSLEAIRISTEGGHYKLRHEGENTAYRKVSTGLQSKEQRIRANALMLIPRLDSYWQLMREALESKYVDVHQRAIEMLADSVESMQVKMLGYAFGSKHLSAHIKATELLARLPAGMQSPELWKAAHKRIRARFSFPFEEKNVLRGLELIPLFPSEYRQLLAKEALHCDRALKKTVALIRTLPEQETLQKDVFAAVKGVARYSTHCWVDAVGLIETFPSEQQDKLFEAASKCSDQVFYDYMDPSGADELIGNFPRKYRARLVDKALAVGGLGTQIKMAKFIPTLPEEPRSGIWKFLPESWWEDPQVRRWNIVTKAENVLLTNDRISQIIPELDIGVVKALIEVAEQQKTKDWDSWKAAGEITEKVFKKARGETLKRAMELIELFPEEMHEKLIESALDSKGGTAIERMAQLPRRFQTEERWKKIAAETETEMRQISHVDTTQRRMLRELMDLFPDEQRIRLYVIAQEQGLLEKQEGDS